MLSHEFVALGGFGDLPMWGDPIETFKPRVRNYRSAVVAVYACSVCGAKAGERCTRPTVFGRVERKLPHFGRGKPGRYEPYVSRREVEG